MSVYLEPSLPSGSSTEVIERLVRISRKKRKATQWRDKRRSLKIVLFMVSSVSFQDSEGGVGRLLEETLSAESEGSTKGTLPKTLRSTKKNSVCRDQRQRKRERERDLLIISCCSCNYSCNCCLFCYYFAVQGNQASRQSKQETHRQHCCCPSCLSD